MQAARSIARDRTETLDDIKKSLERVRAAEANNEGNRGEKEAETGKRKGKENTPSDLDFEADLAVGNLDDFRSDLSELDHNIQVCFSASTPVLLLSLTLFDSDQFC